MNYILIFLSILFLMSSCATEDQNVISDFYMYPNPYNATSSANAKFRVSLTNSTMNSSSPVSIKIYNYNKEEIWSYSTTVGIYLTGSNLDIPWSGENNSGQTVSPGIYYATATIGGTYSDEKTVEIIIN